MRELKYPVRGTSAKEGHGLVAACCHNRKKVVVEVQSA